MIFLGLLLVLLAGGAVALVLTEDTARYILFGYTFELNHVEMFLAGAAAMAALLVGLWLMGSGSRRSARRRRRLRSAKAEASNRVARLEDEKRDLERKLENDHEPGDRLVSRGSEDTRP
jgi:membrane protein DedA with SNARE-associated domain